MVFITDSAYDSVMTDPSKFAKAVKAWRERMGFTQVNAGFRLACGPRTIRNWETGDTTPDLMARLAMAALEAGLAPVEDDRPPTQRYVLDLSVDPPKLIHLYHRQPEEPEESE